MDESIPTETTPFLQQRDTENVDSLEETSDTKAVALPKAQFTVLCLLRTLDPMSFTQIFPYINQFMSDLRVTDNPSRIGFYSGLVESSFAISQLIAVYPWGFFSDRFGRRPVVLAGTLGLSIATILFGLSKSFFTAVLTRALAGLFSGNVSVIPTILIDLTNQSNQTFAFSFFGFWWPVGAILGPLIGGLLSNPANHYPTYFNSHFFRKYPYFLPCFIIACFGLVCFVVAVFALRETLHQPESHEGTFKPSSPYNSPTGMPLSQPENMRRYSIRELLNLPIISALCASGCALSFTTTAFDVLFVLFCFTPIQAGGLSFPVHRIGFALSISGFIAAILQVLLMPIVLERVNHAVLYHFCAKIWPLTFLFMPLLNIIARRSIASGTGIVSPGANLILWIGIAIILCMARIGLLVYSVNMLLIKRFSPNSLSVGSTASLVQFFICFSRAFSPALASFIFSYSKDLLGGYMWVAAMVLLSFGGTIFSGNIVREIRAASYLDDTTPILGNQS